MSNIADHRWLGEDNLADCIANVIANMQGVPTAGAFAGGTKASRVTATAAINNTDTLLLSIPIVASTTLNAGAVVRILIHGTCTSTNADVSTFTLRAGTLGTVADASFATAAVTSSGSGTAVAFEVAIEFTVRVPSATVGTAAGSMRVSDTGATGIAAVTNTIVPFTSATLVGTATFLGVSYVAAAATTTCTFQDVSIEIIP